MKAANCIVCRAKLASPGQGEVERPVLPLCTSCSADIPGSVFTLDMRMRTAQQKMAELEGICRSCSGLSWAEEVRCDSKDCPVFYSRTRARAKERRVVRTVESVRQVLDQDDLRW